MKTEVHGIIKKREGVFLNTDNDALGAYKKRKQQMQKIKDLEQTVQDIKSDMQEIKTLLQKLVK